MLKLLCGARKGGRDFIEQIALPFFDLSSVAKLVSKMRPGASATNQISVSEQFEQVGHI